MIMNLSDQYARFLEEWKKEDELEEVPKVIRMINKKINYVEKEKTNELRKYLYNTYSFDYDIFRKFYLDKYKTYNLVDCKYFDKDDEFEFINVEDKKFKTLLIQTYKSMTELRKICNILNK
jgi:CRISPR-associated protein Cas8b1/Cst1 subtype I-B